VELSWLCCVPEHRAVRTTSSATKTTIGVVFEHTRVEQVFPLADVPREWRYPVVLCVSALAQPLAGLDAKDLW